MRDQLKSHARLHHIEHGIWHNRGLVQAPRSGQSAYDVHEGCVIFWTGVERRDTKLLLSLDACGAIPKWPKRHRVPGHVYLHLRDLFY